MSDRQLSNGEMRRYGMTDYQRVSLRRLQREGWRFIRIIRRHNEDNPVASFLLRDPDGHEKTVGAPATKRIERELLK